MGLRKDKFSKFVRALYGLKSSGEDWRANISDTLSSMGYRSTESDTDVWIKRSTEETGTAYYKYMLVYVDDVLHFSNDAQEDMLKLNQVYLLKECFGPPDIYLGDNFDKVKLYDGITVWSMTCVEYMRGDIKTMNLIREGNKAALKSFRDGHCLYPSSYRP